MKKARPAVIVAAFVVAAQVGVPAYVLATQDQRPARFGWQMYAARVDIPAVTIITRDGRHDVDPPRLANARADVDFFSAFPPAICDRHANAAAVELRSRHPRREQTTTC